MATPAAATTATESTSAGDDGPPRVILLGVAGGPQVVAGRLGISTAVVVDGAVYVVDCGRGALTAYVEAGLALRQLRAVFVSHLHVDHYAELFNFFLFGVRPAGADLDALRDSLAIYGPGPADTIPAFGMGTPARVIAADNATPGIGDLMAYSIRANALYLNASLKAQFPDPADVLCVHELAVDSGSGPLRSSRDGELEVATVPIVAPGATAANSEVPLLEPVVVLEDDRVRVSTILVPHASMYPCFAFRFETDAGSVTISGDTGPSDNLVALARGSDLLLHEVYDAEATARSVGLSADLVAKVFPLVHTETSEVGSIATRADVERLGLHHFVPSELDAVSETRWLERARLGYSGDVIVGRDGLSIPIADPSR